MAKKKQSKTFTKREVDIYALGFRDGENQLQRSINKILAVHQDLAEEMLRLDIEKPVIGDPRFITITLKTEVIERIIRALGEEATRGQRDYHIKKLSQILSDHHKNLQSIAEKVEKGLLAAK